MIAHFAEATKPRLRQLPDATTQLLADLVARRRQIVEMIAAESQRARHVTLPRLKKSIARLRKALEKELSELDDDISDHVRGSPAWAEKEDLLASVPGIGPTIARTLIAELPELGSLDRRQIAALAGLAPWTRQSGKWRGKSFIGGGRASVRRALFMGAMVAARHNPTLKLFRDKLVAAGTSQPDPQAVPRQARCRRQKQARRDRRRRSKAAHHPQRNPARQNPMAAKNRLTAKTVALPASGARL